MANDFSPIFATVWSKEVERVAQPIRLMRKYCVVKEDLLAQPGSKISIPKFGDLPLDGISESVDMEGNEKDYSATAVDLTPVEVKNAVKLKKSELEKTPVDLRREVAETLGNWLAAKEDRDIWAAATATTVFGQNTNVVYGGDANSRSSIDATDKISASKLSKVAACLAEKNAPKFTLDNISCYIGLLHPRQAYDLKQDSTWINAQQYAAIRGSTNPLFTGAIGMLDGVIYFETTQAPTVAGWGCPALTVYQAVIFGQRALALAIRKRPTWVEKELDYNSKVGLAVYTEYKASILNIDHIYRIETAATNIAA